MSDSSDTSVPNTPEIIKKCCNICDPKKKYFNCICGKNWNTFEKHLCDLENIQDNLIIKNISISTMTLCCTFNSHIDLDLLADLYCENVKYKPNAKKTKKHKEGIDCFYNSLLMNMTTKYQTPSKVSIKFFPNGKIQVAGCKTIKSCCYCIRKAYRRLIDNNCFMSKDNYISDTKLVMINSDFKISKNINQKELCELLYNKKYSNFLLTIYQNAKYPAINCKFIPSDKVVEHANFQLKNGFNKKFPGVISLLIFRSGSIIITGGNKIEEYYEAYSTILKIFNDYPTILK